MSKFKEYLRQACNEHIQQLNEKWWSDEDGNEWFAPPSWMGIKPFIMRPYYDNTEHPDYYVNPFKDKFPFLSEWDPRRFPDYEGGN